MRSARLLATVLLAVAPAGCGWTPADEQIVERFFELAKLHDTTRLASIATIAFDPTVEGVVERFEVASRRDRAGQEGLVHRTLRLRTQMRSPAGAPLERTLEVTLEGKAPAQMKVTGVRRMS